MKKLVYSIVCAFLMTACTTFPGSDYVLFTEPAQNETPTPAPEPAPEVVPGIPSDNDATIAPVVTPTVTLPAAAVSGSVRNGSKVVRLDMTGIQDKAGNWLEMLGTGYANQNVWIDILGGGLTFQINKGIYVGNVSEGHGATAKADVVFLIDNSGSMSEEADAVAASVVDWSKELVNGGIDVKFGCVGYDGQINGALNLTDVTSLHDYLDRVGMTGVSRTVGFSGPDATALEANAETYRTGGNSGNECGAAAAWFANDNFASAFRTGANRVYVNFTDEPNQPNGNHAFSVESFSPAEARWPSADGTIHSVFSDTDTTFTNTIDYDEHPWLMADYTGGTKKFTDGYFTGLTLSDLPVSGALKNSFYIEFTNIETLYTSGLTYQVTITVRTPDGSVQGKITLSINFSTISFS